MAPIPRPLEFLLSSPSADFPSADLSDFVDFKDPDFTAIFRPQRFRPFGLKKKSILYKTNSNKNWQFNFY